MKAVYICIALIFLAACSSSPDTSAQANYERLIAQSEQAIVDDHGSLRVDEGPIEGLGVGELPPEVTIVTSDEELNLKDLANEEQPVLLYFMATWCPHCANDFRELGKVYDTYKDDVKIVAMTLDQREGQTKLNDYKARFSGIEAIPLVEADTDVLKKFNVRYTTTKYAIGADGTLVYVGSGELRADQWQVLLNSLRETKL